MSDFNEHYRAMTDATLQGRMVFTQQSEMAAMPIPGMPIPTMPMPEAPQVVLRPTPPPPSFKVGDRVILQTGWYTDSHSNPAWGEAHGNVVGTVINLYEMQVDWDNGSSNTYNPSALLLYKEGEEFLFVPGIVGEPTKKTFFYIPSSILKVARSALLLSQANNSGAIYLLGGEKKKYISHADSCIRLGRTGGCDDLNGVSPDHMSTMLDLMSKASIKHVGIMILRKALPRHGHAADLFVGQHLDKKTNIPICIVTKEQAIGWMFYRGKEFRFYVGTDKEKK